MCYCFRIFWRLSKDCQAACPALVSGPPNRKPYNKHLIGLIFSVCAVNYGPSFFPSQIDGQKTRSVIYSTTENPGNKRYKLDFRDSFCKLYLSRLCTLLFLIISDQFHKELWQMAVDPLSQLTSRDVSVYSEYRDSKLVKSYCTGYTGLEQNWYVAFISKYFIKSTEQSDCMDFLVG